MENYVDFVPSKMARGTIMPDFIMNDERLSTGAMTVFTVLCSYSRDKNYCFPSKETLMQHIHYSFNTLQKYLAQLVEYGYVKISKINGRILFYLFTPKKENQKNLNSYFIELSKIETKVKENRIINNTPPISPSTKSYKKTHTQTPLKKETHDKQVTSNLVEGDFNHFWNIYPRKENKNNALRQFSALKRKKQLPTLEYFRKAIDFFMSSKQWNRENGRFIPQLSNFLNNEKWQEVPMEFFEQKQNLSSHQDIISTAEATKQWEKHKKELIRNSIASNSQQSEILEKNWKEFQSKFKIDWSIKRHIAKAKFFDLLEKGISFGVIEKNLDITPLEYLTKIEEY